MLDVWASFGLRSALNVCAGLSTYISAIVIRFSRSSSYRVFITLTGSASGESIPTAEPGMSRRKKVSVSTNVSSTIASKSSAVRLAAGASAAVVLGDASRGGPSSSASDADAPDSSTSGVFVPSSGGALKSKSDASDCADSETSAPLRTPALSDGSSERGVTSTPSTHTTGTPEGCSSGPPPEAG